MTAVEWLYDWMWTKDHHYFLEGDLALAFSKAKEMEKEQMMQCYEDGYNRVAKLIENATQRNLNL